MLPRERALRALTFQETDRPPVAGGLLQNPAFLAQVAEVEDFWAEPWETLFTAFRRLGCDIILGPVMPKRPETTTTDARGNPTDYTWVESQPTLTTPEQVAAWAETLPAPEAVRQGFDPEQAAADYLHTMQRGSASAGEMMYLPQYFGCAPHFPTSDAEFSYPAFLMACALYPEVLAKAFASWAETARLRAEAVAQATRAHDLPRFLWLGVDLCDANGPMLSPRLMERLYFPGLARALEPLKAAGMKVVWHCDANYRLLLDRMIELGIDGFQGLYETPRGIRLEDLAHKRARSGDPLLFFGSISTVWVLPHGGPPEVRREVERCVETVGPQGGLVLAPSSSIGPEVPAANVNALFEHARTYVPSWRR